MRVVQVIPKGVARAYYERACGWSRTGWPQSRDSTRSGAGGAARLVCKMGAKRTPSVVGQRSASVMRAAPQPREDRRRPRRGQGTHRARFRWVRLSGAPLPSPICPGRARGWGRSGSASAFFAPGATGACARGSARATSCSTAASALLRPSSPPAICSRSRRLSRLLCDLEYGERDASNPV